MKKYFILFIATILTTTFLLAQNVGIGTTNPDEKLTVAGTIKSTINSNSSVSHIEVHEDDNEFGRIKYTNTSSSQYFTLAGNPQPDSTMARFHIYNSEFGNIGSFTGHGRFGINATNPAATFHLNSQPNTDLIRIQNNNSTKFRILSNNAISFGAPWDEGIPNVVRFATPNMFVGFNKDHVPDERLEVDGNVKITGGITADSVQGTPGQILTTGADGDLAWASPCTYNRFLGFPGAGTVPWTVPDGITEIMVELWGAGGGGALGGGGGSGGYVKAIFEVIPGETLIVTTGSGGLGGSGASATDAADGGYSFIDNPNFYVIAIGGKGATTTSFGDGGSVSAPPPHLSATGQLGESGYPNQLIPIYSGTTKLTYGHGGQSPNSVKNYGQGAVDIDTGSTISRNPATKGRARGGGGGGGYESGNKGGDGHVIIRWN